MSPTPREAGYRMPAEWAPHAGCYLVWPERPDTWREHAAPAREAWARVVAAVATSEPVTVLASAAAWGHARETLPRSVRVLEAANDDAWVRDSGPTFLLGPEGRLGAVDWAFNAWGGSAGGLYAPWDADDRLGTHIAELERSTYWVDDMVLEGGSVDVDGEGTLLTTAECLLNPNRNPGLTQGEIEQRLRDNLGVDVVVWLPRGVVDDETDGHVDNFARLVAPAVVLLTWTDDTTDPQYDRSAEAEEVLLASADARGRPFEVVRVLQPGPLYLTATEADGIVAADGTKPRRAGDRLAASYVNAYIGTSAVVVPVFDDPNDGAALAAWAKAYPERQVLPVPGREILLGGGNVHCITQQVPQHT